MRTEKTINVVAPCVHPNGTSQASLVDDLEKAYCAVNAAREAMRESTPNGRDYYVGNVTYDQARQQHDRRYAMLVQISQEIEAQIGLIQDGEQTGTVLVLAIEELCPVG